MSGLGRPGSAEPGRVLPEDRAEIPGAAIFRAARVGPAPGLPGGRRSGRGARGFGFIRGPAPPEPRVAVRPHPRTRGTGDTPPPGPATVSRHPAIRDLEGGGWGWAEERAAGISPEGLLCKPPTSLERCSRCQLSGLTPRLLSAGLLSRMAGRLLPPHA